MAKNNSCKTVLVSCGTIEAKGLDQYKLNKAYIEYLRKMEFLPVIAPAVLSKTEVARLAPMFDGLVLTGGGDIHPATLNEDMLTGSYGIDLDRDNTEKYLYREFAHQNKPILGICRGFQLVGVLEGLHLSKEIYEDTKSNGLHSHDGPRDTFIHVVYSLKGRTLMKKIYSDGDPEGPDCAWTTSLHHQGFLFDTKKKIPDSIQIEGVSADNVIEIFTVKDSKTLCVQFHPEESKDLRLLRYWRTLFAE